MIRAISWLLVCYISHLGWLFTIIECLKHTSIRASFWKYEIVLEDSILATTTNLSTVDGANYFWSIIL